MIIKSWDQKGMKELIKYLLPDAQKQLTWLLLYGPQFKYVTKWGLLLSYVAIIVNKMQPRVI